MGSIRTMCTKYTKVGLGIVFGIASYHTSLIFHTVSLNKLKTSFTLYNDKKHKWDTDSISTITEQVIKDLKIPKEISTKIKPFLASTFDIFHAGTLFYKPGAIIGIPVNYTYTDVDNIDKKFMKINREEMDFETTDGKNFLESLILSNSAKKFAIAQEYLRIQYQDAIKTALISAIIMTISWFIFCIIQHKCSLHEQSKIVKGLIIGGFGLISMSTSLVLKDVHNNYLDSKVDDMLAKLGPEYIKGGKEYYDQLIKRNIALRNIGGNEAKRKYTAIGECKTLIRQRMKPFNLRKNFFESLLLENEKEWQ